MTIQPAQLWVCYSSVLRGFYQSQVTVVADSKEDAIEKALAAFDDYVDCRIEEIGDVSFEPFPPVENSDLINVNYDDDTDEVAAARKRAREAFKAELEVRIEPVAKGALLQVHG
jgi:hypothetical protein